MKYKIGDKVKLKSKEGLDELKRQVGDLYIQPDAYKNAGSEQTILECNEDFYRYDTSSRFWHESLFEGLVEEPITLNGKEVLLKLAGIELPSGTTTIWDLPNGYIFKDENGNVINATKIVLEKKKKEYPKTYEECCVALEYIPHTDDIIGYKWNILQSLQKLLICRDAYWKIAGDWKPEYPFNTARYVITNSRGFVGKVLVYNAAQNYILEFPTEEMRDAFYENFKELIEFVKELL